MKAYWKPGLYGRSYVDRSVDQMIKRPTRNEFEAV
jgi:hypothetical protein